MSHFVEHGGSVSVPEELDDGCCFTNDVAFVVFFLSDEVSQASSAVRLFIGVLYGEIIIHDGIKERPFRVMSEEVICGHIDSAGGLCDLFILASIDCFFLEVSAH